ncbi:hypothetical protein ACSS6W_005136 [Trichoderma asperelloides]
MLRMVPRNASILPTVLDMANSTLFLAKEIRGSGSKQHRHILQRMISHQDASTRVTLAQDNVMQLV